MDRSEVKALLSLIIDNDPDIIPQIENQLMSFSLADVDLVIEELANFQDEDFLSRFRHIFEGAYNDLALYRLNDWLDNDKDIFKFLWIVVTLYYPLFPFSRLYKQVSQIYYEVWLDFHSNLNPFDQVRRMNTIFQGNLGFKVVEPYPVADVSKNLLLVNDVLKSRKGASIILFILYMLIGQKLKMPLSLVRIPDSFLIKYDSPALKFYIHPFNSRTIFSERDVQVYADELAVSGQKVMEDYSEQELAIEIVDALLGLTEEEGLKVLLIEMEEILKTRELK